MRQCTRPGFCIGGLAIVAALLFAASPGLLGAAAAENEADKAPGRRLARSATQAPGARWTTADHSKYEALQKEFTKPEEVTTACLSCHQMAADQIQHSIHWTWICPDCGDGKSMGKYGKTINNFCIAVPSNEPRCTSCHIGYGWKDKTFDFSAKNHIDCLACHDTTHTYEKFPTKAGYPVTEPTLFPEDGKTYLPPDYKKIVAKVGRPDRLNCGACHFYGGGGDGVKHGDLDSSMGMPKKSLDVHMDTEGLNFTCQRCHTTKEHQIAGRLYTSPAAPERISLTEADLASKIACESCHGQKPHKTDTKANDHTDKVACQTCHIPEFARVLPTKMSWDWSTAGRMNADGKPFKKEGPYGKSVYDTKKGDFVWEKNVEPAYYWFNGAMSNMLVTDTVDPSKRLALNHPAGSPDDPKSRIMPFKRHTGKQPFDPANATLVIPHLFGPKDSEAYWANYDWKRAIVSGMKYVDLPFSGEVGFVETEYFFPITHMVAPKDKVVACDQCHSVEGRLKGLPGVYIPGRDVHAGVTMVGWGAVIAAILAVAGHGIGRMVSSARRKGQ
ncbi:tetrathionate reductase family octaheme c-type cytochrome [Desulfovibrio sp. DV]|uniref:tetrathionate reductase family octaheme c-type cytochrome n=1 Tax=Desulfovibrio sp. DV TaxID=1844708 RepID=UPI00094BA519|nr:tetrathionate reductase family octaheme c-type cytochrome [Desulfovibrio sp. DV]